MKWFLERGAKATYEDKGGWNALHCAALSGDPETIDHILTLVPNIESKRADGETPLIIAVRHQKLQGVKCLLEKGANPLAKDNEGQDFLYYASSRDPDLLGLVLSHVADSESTLIFLLMSLVSKKFKISASSLKCDAFFNCFSHCIILGGTSVSEDDKELNQLHSAERDSDVTKIKSTPPLERSVDSRNAAGMTPLMNAAMNGNVQTVKLLIEKGADPSLTDNSGRTSLHFAAAGGDTNIISLIHTRMPDIESLDGGGETPLFVAAYSGELHAVKWFLERGAKAAYEDKRGWNALHCAALSNDPEIIDHILTHVPNIESRTADGATPLILAVLYRKLQCVKCLLERGANPLAKDNEGQDSLYYASSRDPDLLNLVLSHVPDS